MIFSVWPREPYRDNGHSKVMPDDCVTRLMPAFSSGSASQSITPLKGIYSPLACKTGEIRLKTLKEGTFVPVPALSTSVMPQKTPIDCKAVKRKW